jgi:hypothetical protein
VDNAVGAGGVPGIVRDHEQRLPAFLNELAQQRHDLVALHAVEIAGRLIGQEQKR